MIELIEFGIGECTTNFLIRASRAKLEASVSLPDLPLQKKFSAGWLYARLLRRRSFLLNFGRCILIVGQYWAEWLWTDLSLRLRRHSLKDERSGKKTKLFSGEI